MSWILLGLLSFATVPLIFAFPTPILAQTAPSSFINPRPDMPAPKLKEPSLDKLSLADSEKNPPESSYVPMTGGQRLEWFAVQTAGPKVLLTGTFTAGIGTLRNQPRELHRSAYGFSGRYASGFATNATSNLLEAGLGTLWSEDLRYTRRGSDLLSNRLGHALLMTFAARQSNGRLAPAYARLAAIPGSNLLSLTWRPRSESHPSDAFARSGYAFLGRFIANAWDEFWPSVKPHLFPRR